MLASSATRSPSCATGSARWTGRQAQETSLSSGCGTPAPSSSDPIREALVVPRSALALRVEIRGALGDPHGLDRRPASAARLSLAAVDLELGLVLPGLPEEIDVGLVPERGTPHLDRFLHRLLDRAIETTDLLGGEGVRHPVVAESGREQDLVRIDVPQTADELLVHQELLHLRALLGEQVLEGRPCEDLIERVDRDVLELLDLPELVRARHEHLTEGPRVDEAEVTPLLEGEDDMGVRLDDDPSVAALELSAHPEMGDQGIAGIQVQHHVLAPSLHLGQLPSLQPRGEVLALAVPADPPHRVARALHLSRPDPPTYHVLLQVPAHHLDLRQLHVAPYAPTRSEMWSNASRAARCSASFFDLPTPTPRP